MPSFWMYQTQTVFVLTNGMALELAVAACTKKLKLLSQFRSGRTGPVPIQSVYKTMCTPECLQSDAIHEDALAFTGNCGCDVLSTQPITNTSDPNFVSQAYHVPNDWCMQNSARLLCSILGFCGVWKCRVSDFMCARLEWNKKHIPLKGLGSCVKHAAVSSAVRVGAGGGTGSWVWLWGVVGVSLWLAHGGRRKGGL